MNINSKTASILLEVLLSIVILSVSLTLIIQSMTAALRATQSNSEYTLALVLLESKLSQLIQKGFISSGLSEENKFDAPNEDFSYQLNTSLVDGLSEPGDAVKINKIDLDVKWFSGTKQKKLGLETYLFNLPQ